MFEKYVEQLRHHDSTIRYEAARQLGDSRDHRAVTPLIDALKDENAKVQYASFSGLIKINNRVAADPLITFLLDEPENSVWELMKLNIGLRLRMGLQDMVGDDSALIDRLLTVIEENTFEDHQTALFIRLLGRMADTRAVALLMKVVDDDDASSAIRSAAAEALGWLGDAQATEVLMSFAIVEDDAKHREVAIEALGRLRSAQAYELLMQALSDGDEWVRRAAAEALGRLGDSRAMSALVHALDDESEMVHDTAFESIKMLSDDNYNVVL